MVLATLILAGIVSWLMRAAFIMSPRLLPSRTEAVIDNLRPAILGGLVATAFMARANGELSAIPVSWLVASLATAAVAHHFRNLALAAGTGVGLVVAATAIGFAV
jgi:branched-subunit amino acid transport protein